MERKRRNDDEPSSSKPAKMERKTVERNRRIHMNSLLRTFFQLIPPQHFNCSQDQKMGVAELIEQATGYAVQVKESVEQLRRKKAELAGGGGGRSVRGTDEPGFDKKFPILEVVAMGSGSAAASLQVVLIQKVSPDHERVALSEVVRVLHQQGMEVVAINMATSNHNLHHTITAQVKSPRVEVDTSRIAGRLHELLS